MAGMASLTVAASPITATGQLQRAAHRLGAPEALTAPSELLNVNADCRVSGSPHLRLCRVAQVKQAVVGAHP